MSDLIREISIHSGIDLQCTDEAVRVAAKQPIHLRTHSQEAVYFLKVGSKNDVNRFVAEARGLELIALTNTIHTPEVFSVGNAGDNAYILMEFIDMGPQTSHSALELGKQLASMHKTTTNSFGLNQTNWIGLTKQFNKQETDWVVFYRDQRLLPQLELAYSKGYTTALEEKATNLLNNLNVFFEDYSPVPSLLHGDLWSGNWGTFCNKKPVIFDPAVYYGDREADIAMTLLFGGFSQEFYASYSSVWPVSPGFNIRQDLYNFYHVLNHLNIFGSSYLLQSENLLDKLISKL